ncbi:MAG TPA: nitrile hydratase subunit beta [Anaerolineales bacterium]|jgi:nitrile hydratase
MNGAHDLGGMHGMGPITPEPDEPVFHNDWERRVFALTLAAGALGRWNIDMSRFAREQMPGPEYLNTTYYEHWLFGLERLLVEKSLLEPAEIQAGRARAVTPGLPNVLLAEDVARVLQKGASARRTDSPPPRFRPGDQVVARNLNPAGHTRLPRYARGRRGVVERDHGVFVFPDSNAMERGENPQHCYSVRFTLRDLWGPHASARDSVHIDLWDDHLEPA